MRFLRIVMGFLGMCLLLPVGLECQPWGGVGRGSPDNAYPWILENRETRVAFKELSVAPLDELLRFKERIVTQRTTDTKVKVRTERANQAVYLLFLNEHQGEFPVYGAGSWILKRDERTGALLQIKIFYRTDPGCFVRLFPNGKRTMMDVYLFDSLLHRSVPLGISLTLLLGETFKEIVERTQTTVDWHTLLHKGSPTPYKAVVSMVEKIRKELPHLPDAEDGAMDREGKLVYIASLGPQTNKAGFNCSGFAKWVADGLYKPKTGSYMDIEFLKERHTSLRGNRFTKPFETNRDPFFGLDWTRNIACALSGNLNPEGQDVRDLPFWQYREDIGFPVQEIKGILYYLAVKEPGSFYFGSINREFGKDPVIRQHVHVVVLFPYFDAKNQFQVAIFERNVESSVASLVRRYGKEDIHLVRASAEHAFEPPRLHKR